MLSGVLYNQFGMRGMFLVVGAGLIAIALAYLTLYHVALKRSPACYGLDEKYFSRGEKVKETSGEKQEGDEKEPVPEFFWSTRL